MRATNKTFHVVIGLGQTGLSCVRYLSKHNIPVAAIDSRSNPPALEIIRKEFPSLPFVIGKFDKNILSQAKVLVVSPGVSLQSPEINDAIMQGIPAIGDIELFVHAAKAPIIAITGSNGKSTVTTLVTEMARHAGLNIHVGGNIGIPVLELLEKSVPDFYVLELSSWQLETTFNLQAAAAVILNISDNHLDRHGNLANYIAAKRRIYQNCHVAIVNRAECFIDPNAYPHTISFGLDTPAPYQFGIINVESENYLAYGDQLLLSVNKLALHGQHNWANALAALALLRAMGVEPTQSLNVLEWFTGLPHRCQFVRVLRGISWYNDSKATTVAATCAALEGLGNRVLGELADISKQQGASSAAPTAVELSRNSNQLTGKLILLAGGIGKQADFSLLRTAIKRYVRHVILFGTDAQLIGKALTGYCEFSYVTSLQEAVILAEKQAQPGDGVILSPACASYDMFKNFEHRGELFIDLVRRLK